MSKTLVTVPARDRASLSRVNGVQIDGPRTPRDADVITIGPFAIEVHIAASGESDRRATVVGD